MATRTTTLSCCGRVFSCRAANFSTISRCTAHAVTARPYRGRGLFGTLEGAVGDETLPPAPAEEHAIISGGELVEEGTPREIYERPVNRFVADFLGPTNFLSARIVESAPDALVLDTAVGRLRAHKHHDAAHTQPGAEVTALIRPESFSIAQDGGATSANILRGKRAETIYLGEMAQHWIDVEPKLRIRYYEMNPGRTPDASPDITLAVDPREVIVLPA